MTMTRGSTARRLPGAVPVLLLLLIPLSISGQSVQYGSPGWADAIIEQEGYAAPPAELAEAVLAPRYLNVSLSNPSPDKKWFLDEIGDGPVAMRTFAKPFHELGGVFIDYEANRARALTIRNNAGIQIVSGADGSRRPIQVPAGLRVSNSVWSPDGASIAYLGHSEDATHIYVADVATGKSRQLTKAPLLATLVSSFEFAVDGRSIAAVIVPDTRPAMPASPSAPEGPTVKIADDNRNRLRTYASLMSTPYEKRLLAWHATGQLALIDARKGTVTKVGAPAMIRGLDASPDGRFVRVTRIVPPFSYDVPVNNFGTVEEIWDREGKALATVTDRPLNLGVQDNQPGDPPAGGGGRGGQQAGKREVAWRADGQGLTYLEQEPPPPGEEGGSRAGRGGRDRGAAAAGDQPAGRGARAPQRPDRLYHWLPPFDEASLKVLYESNTRMSGVRFSPDMKMFVASERQGQNVVEFAVYLDQTSERHVLARYRSDDVYANPGSILSVRGGGGGGGRGGRGGRGGGGGGGPVLLSPDGTAIYRQGNVYDRNPDEVGPKTFVDKVVIRTGEKTRLYESDNDGVYERITTPIDLEAGRFIVSRESPSEVEQNYLVDSGGRTQLTENRDHTPDVTGARRERFTVTRADGFTFRVTVTLPASYQASDPPPGLFWFYPREYEDQESYDRPDRTFNRNAFPNFGVRSVAYFVRLGYAVVEPDSPIVGPQGQMNNNYVHDLRNNLAAVIDELDRRRLADRTRLGIGGHSYGAFSTVNAMVHTPFFRAGIAGDGNYNRTLTPIGFQSERRDIWEAPHVYLGMSPFLYANNLTGALLMYHGMADQNVGTDPTNSIRLYHALNGLGKTTALYLYPLEDHGPASKETLLDLWARWAAWLDKHVKNGKAPAAKITTTDQASR